MVPANPDTEQLIEQASRDDAAARERPAPAPPKRQ
jgi:hypothetical protein